MTMVINSAQYHQSHTYRLKFNTKAEKRAQTKDNKEHNTQMEPVYT